MEPAPHILADGAASGREAGLWQRAPAWRNLTAAASLLTLAAVAAPLLLPEQPAPSPAVAKPAAATIAAPPAATAPLAPPPVPQARADHPAPSPPPARQALAEHPAELPPAPAPAAPQSVAAASGLPSGGLVVPAGVLTEVNRHNRRGAGHDWPISITIVSPPAHGKVTSLQGTALLKVGPGVQRNSDVTEVFYQSDPGYSGRDSFSYRRISTDPADPLNANLYTMVIDVHGQAPSASPSPSPSAPPPAPLIRAAPPAAAQTASLAAPAPMPAPAPAQPAQACGLALPYQAQAMGSGVVIGIEPMLQAQRRLRANELAVGGPISPGFAMTARLIVRMDGGGPGAPSQIVVLPPGMNARIGDRIAFNGIHRDPDAACSYIPPLLTSDAGPAAQGTPAGGPVSPKP